MTRRFGRVFLFSVAGVVCAASALAQQAPAVVASGGYQQMRGLEFSLPDVDTGHWGGWYADIAGSLRKSIAVVGEVAEHRKRFDVPVDLDGLQFTVHAESRFQWFLGGVRVAARNHPRVVPFVQALGGIGQVIGKGTVESDIGYLNQTMRSSSTRGAMEIGGGLDVMPTHRIGFRVGANYLHWFASHAPKIWVYRGGVVVGLGR